MVLIHRVESDDCPHLLGLALTLQIRRWDDIYTYDLYNKENAQSRSDIHDRKFVDT